MARAYACRQLFFNNTLIKIKTLRWAYRCVYIRTPIAKLTMEFHPEMATFEGDIKI